jgi:hypothetical protein
MLHFTKITPHSSDKTSINIQTPANNVESQITTCLVSQSKRPTVLLATMLIKAKASDGYHQILRALVDSGSEASFITVSCADKLALPLRRCSAQIRPFAGSPISIVSGIITVTLSAHSIPEPTVTIDAMTVPKIIDKTPSCNLTSTTWLHLKNLPLADPTYKIPGSIDILLGADILPSLVTGDRVAGKPYQPVAFNTLFVWVVLGQANQSPSPVGDLSLVTPVTTFTVQSNAELESSLTRFWTLEEPSSPSPSSIENTDPAEQVFLSSVTRTTSGRFCIELPFKTPKPIIGDSKGQALHRFRHLEWRLSKNDEIRTKYKEFMQDYLDSNHMEIVPVQQRYTPFHYYIPHHYILRPDSQTTKLRVVFDASAKSSTGISLNDCLHTGPKMQADLSHILMQSRVHRIVFTADINTLSASVFMMRI